MLSIDESKFEAKIEILKIRWKRFNDPMETMEFIFKIDIMCEMYPNVILL